MLIKQIYLSGIKNGTISYQFRKWKSPRVKKGSLIKTSIGILKILDITDIKEKQISDAEAIASGFSDSRSLLTELNKREGKLYKIQLSYHAEDPRLSLREDTKFSNEELAVLLKKMNAMERRSAHGNWIKRVLVTIKNHPRKRAQDLADELHLEKQWLKLNIRKLKNLGLTISLKIGYRLSKRGEYVLSKLSDPS